MPSYIDDGYTRDDGYIAAALQEASGERLYESLEFTYRVATRRETIKLDAQVKIAMANEAFDPECALNAEMLACEFVASHVKSWSLKARGIHPVAITGESCSRMNNYLFGHLYRIIRGVRVSDAKPPATEPPKSDAELVGNSEPVSG